MKKVLTMLSVFAVVFAMAASAVADGTLFSKADGWYYDTDVAGTLTVKDNKVTFTYDVEAGVNPLGLQRNYTGQLKFVGFKVAVVECEHNFNQWNKITIQERTCTQDGIYLWPCDYCDETFEEVIPGYHFMNDHSYDWSCWEWVEEDATCTQEGFYGFQCRFCGEKDGVEIPALGHVEVLGVAAEIVAADWNGENGSDARFDVTLGLTFTVSRDGDIVDEVVFVDAYFRNNNFNNLTETFELAVGCCDVEVNVVLGVTGSNQSAEFSVDSVSFEATLVCED